MRIIAGEFRGRRLLAPETDATRPITDRVKQSVFDILTSILPDSTVYDCFAGTGSMGLESLSRGCARVTFFESDRSAVARLRKNIAALGVADRCEVFAGDLFERFTKSDDRPVNIVFLDPPYRYLRERPNELKRLAAELAERHLAEDATIVLRHHREDAIDLPPLRCVDRRDYGEMTLEFLNGSGPSISA